jgi:DMSO/TMAO reductase YedYZ molybdopterin-dependent catalytic subunit
MSAQPKKSKFNPKVIAVIAITIIVVIASVSVTAVYLLPQKTQLTDQPTAMNLLLIGADAQQCNLTRQDIMALQAYTAPGGFRKSGGAIAGVGNYTGVPIFELISLVGGISQDDALTVSASDGYTMSYTYNQVVNGADFTTFDPITGSQVSATSPLKMVLIYSLDGQSLASDEGPLRIGVLGSEGLLTTGNQWVKMVTQLQVTHNSPEPTSTQTPEPTARVTPIPTQTASPTASPTNLPIPDLTLSIVASNGTKITLTSKDLVKMSTLTYPGGSRRSNGEIVNVGNYTGVKLSDVCSLVGYSRSNIVTVKASDGYASTYSYDQVANGSGFNTYDSTGSTLAASHPLYLILAYWFNGAGLDSDSGPLKVMIVGQDGLVTNGNLAARMVVEVDVS